MPQMPNSPFTPHWELVEIAEHLMNQAADPENFLPAYDAALSSGDDLPLLNFCLELLTLSLRLSRHTLAEEGAAPIRLPSDAWDISGMWLNHIRPSEGTSSGTPGAPFQFPFQPDSRQPPVAGHRFF